MTTKIPAWSYSSLSNFEQCPRQFKLLKIDKVVPFKETDAIRHGNAGNSAKNVFLSLTLHDNLLKFIVKDEGPGFNHECLPDPTAPENLYTIGGRGVFLMKQLSDSIRFDNNGNTIEMSFCV